jgi:hypothetical protein
MNNNYSAVKWKNYWRATWILLLLAVFFGCMDWVDIAKGFGAIGGIFFIFMFVIRFDDVKAWGERNEKNFIDGE